MKPEQRLRLLKLAAMILPGLYLLNFAVIDPAFRAWGEQGERIAALQKKVTRGQGLLDRAKTIRGRWEEMQQANLPADLSAAGQEAYSALGRWTSASGVSLASFDPQWQSHDASDYDTYDARASLTGSLVNVGRFIYELEADATPVNLEECEIATRDPHGNLLSMTARFSFIHLGPGAGSASANTASTPARSGSARNTR